MAIFAEITKNKYISKRHPLVRGDNLTSTARLLPEIECKLVIFTNRKLQTGF